MTVAIPFPGISPEIFTIEIGGLAVALRWYAMAYIVGILAGWRIGVATLKRPALWPGDAPPMSPRQFEELLTWIILGVVAGGRLGFVLFYQPGHYLRHPQEIVQLWQGGMAFHGGLAGVALAVVLFCRRHGISLPGAADLLALATPVGLLLGRIANFINAELWGRPTDLPWGVIFPGARAQDCPGVIGPCARHPSQLYEAALEGALLLLLLLHAAWRRGWLKHPGSVAGLFLGGYALTRALVELVRQPDPQFVSPDNPIGHAVQFGDWGLTMGQLLSLPMLVIGIWLYLRALRHDAAG